MNLNILNGKFNLCGGSQVWSKAQDLENAKLRMRCSGTNKKPCGLVPSSVQIRPPAHLMLNTDDLETGIRIKV